ncbi:hypothetical protein B9Z19DRAFT_1127757 [Tuber borchii]|uniref:Uncharacterized protein n=1 Tax=Tuber borchii TaxID=42251 RepID=A0A2T6ZQP6_TUBBO|nr:hypothetical protein B9Z19DRAFT_1127757 [Tuber borchii]
MHNDSDAEYVSHPPVHGLPSSHEDISGAGIALGDITGYTELNRAMTDDPWRSFSSEDDLYLANWLVRSKLSKSHIDAYFPKGLGGPGSRSLLSANTMRQHINVLDPFGEYLVWVEAGIDDGQYTATFYYRNIIHCVRYLIR